MGGVRILESPPCGTLFSVALCGLIFTLLVVGSWAQKWGWGGRAEASLSQQPQDGLWRKNWSSPSLLGLWQHGRVLCICSH